MESESIADTIKVIRQDVVNDIINAYISPNSLEELWNIPSLETALAEKFLVKLPIAQWLQEDSSLHEQSLRQKILEILTESYELKEKKFGDKKGGDVAGAGYALERASGGDGLFAPGNSFTRYCAKESQV